MELKKYQRQVIRDLKDYLNCVEESGNLTAAWHEYLGEKDLTVGLGVPEYHEKIAGVPHVCFKVPTGGGKTFLACVSVKKIFRRYLRDGLKFVVWLVPSDSILTQTVEALSNPNHPYRKQLDRDFEGRVEVYTKEMLLQAQNFSPQSVMENFSICVMSYASLRIDSKKKDVRKVYQENGALKSFADYFNEPELTLADTPETALINVLRKMQPLVVVDESHNASSNLSIDMLEKLNPSFILELTATPKTSSNIISYVTPKDLKAESMVKLPVVVFNKDSVQNVLTSAIKMRGDIELEAVENFKRGGKYIRPIVLFQAQPNSSDDSETFDKIKNKLLAIGIPAEEIAIKTSTVNELGGVDLLSADCKVRYIITVNALKEGWDCPFAYILASLANRNSRTDVEQIVGRILRQPYAQPHNGTLLNISCVFTCSQNFSDTLDKIIAGMELAGFTSKECRVAENSIAQDSQENGRGTGIDSSSAAQSQAPRSIPNAENPVAQESTAAENLDAVNPLQAKEDLTKDNSADVAKAKEQAKAYEKSQAQSTESSVSSSGATVTTFEIREEFRASVADLKIPQFVVKVASNFFGENYALLERDNLMDGFNLGLKDAEINFAVDADDLYAIDIDKTDSKILQRKKLLGQQRQYFIKYLESLPPGGKIRQSIQAIAMIISSNDKTLPYCDICNYVKRIVEGMSNDELKVISRQYSFYASKIQQKINELKNLHRKSKFKAWLHTGEITCQNLYPLSPAISLQKPAAPLKKSLYISEKDDMNTLERRMVKVFVESENIKWWHRNIERRDFRLNGFINHYPDFLAMTDSGKLLLVETKGDYLDGEDSKEKLSLGQDWQLRAGQNYRYFMVFDNKDLDGAVRFDSFVNEIQSL